MNGTDRPAVASFVDVRQGRLGWLGVIALVGAAAVPTPARAADVGVEVRDNAYAPATVRIIAGDTVVWSHTGSNPHSVTADDGSFDSHPNCGFPAVVGCMGNGDQFRRTFSQAGTVRYFCKIHGGSGGLGMAGVIEIVPAGSGTTAPPPPPTSPPPGPTTTAAPPRTTTTAALPTATTLPAPTSTVPFDPFPTAPDGGGPGGDQAAGRRPLSPGGDAPGANAVARPLVPASSDGGGGSAPFIFLAVVAVAAAGGVLYRYHRLP